jgi:hypothetical protein
MEYQLTGLQEHTVFTGQPTSKDNQTDFTINWSFDLDISMPEDNRFVVKIDATINVSEPENHPAIGKFSASHFFTVFDADPKLINENEGAGMFNFLATLVGISLGSMRGLSYARTVGILGGGVFMPVVNPTELLKLNIKNIIAKMENQIPGIDNIGDEKASTS